MPKMRATQRNASKEDRTKAGACKAVRRELSRDSPRVEEKSIRLMQSCDDALQEGKGIAGAVGLALFEVRAALSHRVGHMNQRENRNADGLREGVKCCCLHLDPKNSLLSGRLNRLSRLAKRRIRGPGGADHHAWSVSRNGLRRCFDKPWVSLGEFGSGCVVVARPLVAQRAIDNNEIGRRARRHDLTCRCEAEQKPTAAREQFFRDQDRERGAHDPSNNAYLLPAK